MNFGFKWDWDWERGGIRRSIKKMGEEWTWILGLGELELSEEKRYKKNEEERKRP